MSNEMLTHFDAGVCTITFNRLERNNSIAGPMRAALTEALGTASANALARVAVFSLPFDLGRCPEAVPTLLLPQLLGYRRAAESLLLGVTLVADAALEFGLVNKVLKRLMAPLRLITPPQRRISPFALFTRRSQRGYACPI
jgi:enoyl-CoA hydratase/carnithine racemase